MSIKPTILSTKIIAKSHLFTIEGLDLNFNNGQQRQFERIRGHAYGSVMILPILNQETFLLVREYTAGIDDYTLAFPKGSVEREEELLITANRELKEEVGYGARSLKYLTRLSASPAYMTSMMHIIVAEDLYPDRLAGDEPEPPEVVPWQFDRLDELLIHPEFHEGRSIAALLLFLRQKNG